MSRRALLSLGGAVLFLTASVVALTISSATPTTLEVTQPASAVTYVSAEAPTTNYDSSPMLRASRTSYRALLQFNTSIPAGATVKSATLTIDGTTATAGAYEVYNVAPFDPTTVTWTTRPALTGAPLGDSGSSPGPGLQTIALTGLTVGEVTDLAVTFTHPGTIASLSGLSTNAPVLDVVYTPPPPTGPGATTATSGPATSTTVPTTNPTSTTDTTPTTTAPPRRRPPPPHHRPPAATRSS